MDKKILIGIAILLFASFSTEVTVTTINDERVSIFSQSITDSDLQINNINTNIKGQSGNVDVEYAADNPTSSSVTSNATVYLISDTGDVLNESTTQITVASRPLSQNRFRMLT